MLVPRISQEIQVLVILRPVRVIIPLQVSHEHVIQFLEHIVFRKTLYELGLIVKHVFNLWCIHVIHKITDNRPVVIFQIISFLLRLKILVHDITTRFALTLQLLQQLDGGLWVRRIRFEPLH